VSPKVKKLFFTRISSVDKNISVGNVGGIESLYVEKRFRNARRPVFTSIFIYIAAPGGISRVLSSDMRDLESLT
jgi:hypothetical protein